MLTFCLITLGDLAIPLAGTGTLPVPSPGQVAPHGYCDEAKVGWLNPAADMFVLLSWEQSTQHSRHPRGTAI